jgi:hypothetical protein
MFKISKIVLILVLLASCTTSKQVIIKLQPKEDDIVTKSVLTRFLNKNNSPTLVIRVPEQKSIISGSNIISLNNTYNIMEKEFLKNDFTVRDRAIFEKIVDQNQQIDYSGLQKLTGVDLIIEFVGATPFGKSTNVYYDKKGNQRTMYPNAEFTGWTVEFKVVKVKENQVAGNYSFSYTPCINGCRYTYTPNQGLSGALSVSGREVGDIKYETITTDAWAEFVKNVTDRLIQEVRK